MKSFCANESCMKLFRYHISKNTSKYTSYIGKFGHANSIQLKVQIFSNNTTKPKTYISSSTK